jgi:hypothetical protein
MYLYNLSSRDLNIYSELKTNLGLFNVKKPLNLKLLFSGLNLEENKILLNIIKF